MWDFRSGTRNPLAPVLSKSPEEHRTLYDFSKAKGTSSSTPKDSNIGTITFQFDVAVSAIVGLMLLTLKMNFSLISYLLPLSAHDRVPKLQSFSSHAISTTSCRIYFIRRRNASVPKRVRSELLQHQRENDSRHRQQLVL